MLFNFIQPLNLEQIFVSNFAGTAEIFIFISVIFITALAARFRMPNDVALPIFILFVLFMAGTTLAGSLTGIYVITLILSSFFIYYGVSRYFK